VYVCV